MDTNTRRMHTKDLFQDLRHIRVELTELVDKDGDQAKRIAVLRAKMACVEHQIAILRLAQAEDRLVQYFWRAVFGLTGAVAALFSTFILRS